MPATMTDTLTILLPYVTATAALIQTVTVVVAAWFAVRQLNEGVKSRYLDGLQRVYEELSNDQARNERAAVFALPDTADPTRATFAEELARVRTVTARYDFIGHLVKSGILPAKYVIPVYYLQVVQVWTKTQPYMDYIRHQRGLGAAYHLRFEDLYRRCERYLHQHNPDAVVSVPYATLAPASMAMIDQVERGVQDA